MLLNVILLALADLMVSLPTRRLLTSLPLQADPNPCPVKKK